MGLKTFFKGKRMEFKEHIEVASEERKADRMARRQATSEARQIAREERSSQMIMFAREREKVRGEQRIKSLRQPRPSILSSLMSSPSMGLSTPRTRTVSRRRKGKKKKGRRVARAPVQREQKPMNINDMFGNGGFV